jgi:CheY-like chemotaxis protein
VGRAVGPDALEVDFDLPGDLRPAHVDPAQIGQAILNILWNAYQAAPRGSRVRVRAWNVVAPHDATARGVALSIEDEGCGIGRPELGRIFDPFFSTRPGQLGLGLTVARSIVHRHGGQVEVLSTPGAGTRVTVYLPVWAHDDAVTGAIAPRQPPCPRRVLVMDDEPALLDVLARLIDSLGYAADCATDGAQAARLYEAALREGRPFGLVILDLTIPHGMGGLETLERLLALDPAVRAVVSSGYSQDPIMADHQSHGFIGVLKKPYGRDRLQRLLCELLGPPSVLPAPGADPPRA